MSSSSSSLFPLLSSPRSASWTLDKHTVGDDDQMMRSSGEEIEVEEAEEERSQRLFVSVCLSLSLSLSRAVLQSCWLHLSATGDTRP